MVQLFSHKEIQKHDSAKDCWVILYDKVYDLTSFLREHPGGQSVILKYAGKDGTAAFDPIHSKDILETLLPSSALVGQVDPSSVKEPIEEKPSTKSLSSRPPLSQMLNLSDFEKVAETCLSDQAWGYYSSGGDDEVTLRENQLAFQRIWLRPRVLVNVKHVDPSISVLNSKASFPVYITATALGKLGHPDGEKVLTRAAAACGIPQMVSTLASCSFSEIMQARQHNQPIWFQLYVNADRNITKKLVEKAEKLGASGIFITVDAPQLGRREKDMRTKFTEDLPDVQQGYFGVNRNEGAARTISAFIDPSLSWDEIPWIMSLTKLPFFIKGIQTGEDAVLAAKAGVSGIVLSNHGGRQLDTSRSAIEILQETMSFLRREGLEQNLDVFVDGGFRRGTDIFKAIAMGAKAVGIGRPFLYAMSGYGQEGVEKAITLLKEEFEMVMRLMGVTSIDQISGNHVQTSSLSFHAYPIIGRSRL